MGGQDSEEKRKAPRFLKKAAIKISSSGEDKELIDFLTCNISEAGVQIVTNKSSLASGQKAEIMLDFFHDPLPLKVSCQVVYVKEEGGKYKVGLEFMEMEEFDRKRLKKLLQREERGIG